MSNVSKVESIVIKSPLLTEQQASEYLRGVAVRGLREWRTKGIGPNFIKVGIKVFYKIEALDEFIEEQTKVMVG